MIFLILTMTISLGIFIGCGTILFNVTDNPDPSSARIALCAAGVTISLLIFVISFFPFLNLLLIAISKASGIL